MLHDPLQPPPGYVLFDETRMGWPEIDPTLMEDGRGVVPGLPLNVLPPDGAAGSATPRKRPARRSTTWRRALLAAVGALCGAGVMARVSAAWAEPLVLWQALVGWPSSGKSPALAGDAQPAGRDRGSACAPATASGATATRRESRRRG